MNSQIEELIQSFEPDSKNSKKIYDQFILFIYLNFDRKIKSVRNQNTKNKYKEIRKRILEYTVSHKSQIVKELNRNK